MLLRWLLIQMGWRGSNSSAQFRPTLLVCSVMLVLSMCLKLCLILAGEQWCLIVQLAAVRAQSILTKSLQMMLFEIFVLTSCSLIQDVRLELVSLFLMVLMSLMSLILV